jgi:CarD family transcriptional regulator
MVANDTTVLVPVNNVADVGVRRAVGGDEINRLFLLLSDGKIDSQQNWKGRFKDNSERMRTGSLYDVVEVLKSLTFLAKSKTLSFREKRMLDRARFLVVSEIAEVTHEPLNNIEQKVDTALDSSIAAKARGPVKAAVAALPRTLAATATRPVAATVAKNAKGGSAVVTKRVAARTPQA